MLLSPSLQARLFNSPGKSLGFYILAHSLYTMLVGSFEVAIILRLTGRPDQIIFFNFFMYILLYGFFILGSFLLRSGRSSRGLRLDLLIQASSGLWAVLNFGRLDQTWVLATLFIFKGMSEGMYWSTRHSTILSSIPDKSRDGWFLKLQTITILLNVLVPISAGAIISFVALPPPVGQELLPPGYYPVFLVSSILAFVAFLVSPTIKIKEQTLTLKRVRGLQKDKGLGTWRLLLSNMAITGIAVPMALGILNFEVLKTEFNMGLFAAWIASGSALFFFFIRWLTRKHPVERSTMVLIGATGESTSRMLYFFFFNLTGLVAKSFVDSFIAPLKSIFGENIMRARIERVSRYHGLTHTEVVLYQESVLFVMRMVACLVLMGLLAFAGTSRIDISRGILLAFMFAGLLDFFLLRKVHRGNTSP